MALLALIAACILLMAGTDAQVCPEITADDLGSSSAPSGQGLIAQRLALVNVEGGQPQPAVQLLRFSVVCEVTAGIQGGYRHASLVAEYRNNNVLELSQFDFSCVEENSVFTWSIMAGGSTDDTVTFNPSADFSTPLRRDCYLCLNPTRANAADEIHHCAPCASQCVGLRQCTSQFFFTCCNYYNQAGNCVQTCPSPTVPQADNTCDCPLGTTGANCDIPVDFCDPNPCMNSGICTRITGGFECTCLMDHTGERCETLVDPCDATPCLNGGTCTRESSTEFTCACREGYGGDTCLDINECTPVNPCRNGGSCRNTEGSYTCECVESWEGPNCETCGISNCTQCSEDGTTCLQCAEGFVINDENRCSVRSVNFFCEQTCSGNGFCVQGTCVCLPGFVNPPNCTAQCTLDNCEQCTPDGVACQLCAEGYVVESNGGLCVRGISREINLTDIQIIAIVVSCAIALIFILLLVICCCTFSCKSIYKNRPTTYVKSKPPPEIKPKKRRVRKHPKKKAAKTSMINDEVENGLGEDAEGYDDKDLDIDITHF